MTPLLMKKARKKLKMTKPEISDELEISERYWAYRESGARPITRWLARAIRDLLNNPKNRA
jgi:hypothetical protein